MEGILNAVKFVAEHASEIILALNGILVGVIGIALLIPGEQPEKALQGVVDFLSKFSKKKAE